MSKTIFLSTVTNEFGRLRARLAALVQRTKRLHVRHEKDFTMQGVLTLQMLEDEIEKSDAVIHIIGNRRGSIPPADQVDALLKRHPKFEQRFPDAAAAARNGKISYTQWEAWLAFLCEKKLFSYVVTDRLNKEPSPQDDADAASQRAHWQRLNSSKRYPKTAANDDNLYDEIILTLVDQGYLTESEARRPINLPYLSLGTLFKGRDEFLRQLRDSLRKASGGHTTAIVGKALYGLGGIGKTRLAVEYAWQYAEDYTALLFVTGDSPEALRRNLAALCGPLVLDL